MSLIQLIKFRTWQTGQFKLPRLEAPCFQTGNLSVVASWLRLSHFYPFYVVKIKWLKLRFWQF